MTDYQVTRLDDFKYGIITSKIGLLSVKSAFEKVLENEKMTAEERREYQNLVRDIKEITRK